MNYRGSLRILAHLVIWDLFMLCCGCNKKTDSGLNSIG